ncbi:hypothetical protein ACFL6M_01240 [Candidatus Eisenbacteria bacterium]|uniref:Uncharacterized protein n=1 Tax=Eiseniibacteriota bacterium TaxID=2212470 RepID=A0ABV6YIP1_UNCEI
MKKRLADLDESANTAERVQAALLELPSSTDGVYESEPHARR